MSDASLVAKYFPEILAVGSMIVGGVWAVVTWIFGRHVKRVDSLDKRVDNLERNTVGRIEHEASASEFRKEMRSNASQINKRLDDILLAVTGKK